ncbi:MAG: hypothetical protein MUC62_04335, partial [Candidatus Thermoplasmatota archaeon]|nr:hypothetical protein [Candidatus Thermoplasmatota archaeon]
VKRLEDAFGFPLVVSRKGGSSGGSSVLTPEGKELLEEYSNVRTAALSGADGELMRVTVVLAARDGKGRYASVGGRLPGSGASVSEPPDMVLKRLIAGTDHPCQVLGDPTVRMGNDGGLLLIYKASISGTFTKGCSLDELAPEDRVLLE